jgi:ferric-dicitrate binding protein FerR (iron transport regulator)
VQGRAGIVPEQVSGQSGDPSPGDSEQWFRATLARLEEQQAALAKAVAELATQLAEVAQAEAILRRASSPRHRPAPRRRRGGTYLQVVKVALVAVLGLGAVLALMAPQRMQRQQYQPRCTVSCARPAAHHTGARP